MNTKLALRGVLIVIGILILVYIGAALTHPEKTKTRAQRIQSVNAAPRMVMSQTLSNTTSPTNPLPSVGK